MAKYKIKEGIVERQLGSTTTVHTFTGFNGHFNVIPEISGSSDSAFPFLIWLLLGLTGNHIEPKYNRGVEGFKKLNVSLKFGRQDQPDITVSRQVNVGKNDAFYIDNQFVEKEDVMKLFASNDVSYISVDHVFETMKTSPRGRSWLFQEMVGKFSSKSKEKYLKEKLQRKKRKADEIRKLLREVITPKLQNMLKVEVIHRKWKEEISRLERLHYAYTFHQQESQKDHLENAIRILTTEIKQDHMLVETMKKESLDLRTRFNELQTIEIRTSSETELVRLRVNVGKQHRRGKKDRLAEISKQLNNKTISLKEVEENGAMLITQASETEASLMKLKGDIELCSSKISLIDQEVKNYLSRVKNAGSTSVADNTPSDPREIMQIMSETESLELREIKRSFKAKAADLKRQTHCRITYQQEHDKLKGLLDSIKESQGACNTVIQAIRVEIVSLTNELDQLKSEFLSLDEIKQKDRKDYIAATRKGDNCMSNVRSCAEKLLVHNRDYIKVIKRLTSNLSRYYELFREHNSAVEKIESLTREHEWISLEKENFGKKGSMYDFAVEGIEKSLESAKILRSQLTYNGELVNANAETELKKMKGQEDQHETELQKIMVDIDAIESEIKNRHAEKELKLEKVKKDFKDLSQKILPGRNSSIRGDLFDEGLEIVSGGDTSVLSHCDKQSQLLSLAFLLSLMIESTETSVCLVDEVDSGLEGAEIKTIQDTLALHFPQVQFILLPLNLGTLLKEANVLLSTDTMPLGASLQHTPVQARSALYLNQSSPRTTEKSSRIYQQ